MIFRLQTTSTSSWRPLGSLRTPVVISTCLVLLAVIAGCDKQPSVTPSTSPGTDSAAVTPGTSDAPNSEPLVPIVPPLKGWESPRAVLVLSGEQHGYVEPCGCSETQSGGLARRHDLFKQLAAKGWPTAGLDLGGALKRTRKQSELKFAFTHNALADMSYKAFGFGPEELRMGPDFLFTAHSEAGADERADVPFVSANVVIYGTRDLGTPIAYRIFEVGDVKVGVTSVVGKKYAAQIKTDPSVLAIEDPAAAIAAVLPQLEAAEPDVLVLLAHAPPSESTAFAKQFPAFDVVVTAEGPEDPLPDAELVGDTQLLRVSQKGKSVGVIGVFGTAESPELRYELVNLDKYRFATSLDMVAHMATYQEAIKAMQLSESEPAVAHPSGTEFVGAEACGKCHRKAFGIWSKSRHGHAFESLAHGRPGMQPEEWVNRQSDPECLSCHVTGWSPQDVFRFETGFVSAEKTPHLATQGCENCHGPGAAHSELEWEFQKGAAMSDAQKAERLAMHLDKATAKANVCIKCHDYDNSPNFDFETYWPKVQHSGRD